MIDPKTQEALDRKMRAGTAMVLSLACLKLELPVQVFEDHRASVQEYLEAENEVSKLTNNKLAHLQERVGQLVEALPA